MSYDLNIWSNKMIETDQREISIGEYTITIEKSVVVEDEDIPIDVMLLQKKIKYLTALHLQPYTDDKIITDKAIRYARKLAKDVNGIVENPQSENKLWVKYKKHLLNL